MVDKWIILANSIMITMENTIWLSAINRVILRQDSNYNPINSNNLVYPDFAISDDKKWLNSNIPL